jgi:DNA-binding XRE family transcriptional regulator
MKGTIMEKRMKMDYIYSDENQEILIETEQKDTRSAVIEQYIRYRKEKGMTQAELAQRAGISRSNITRFESGTYNPSLEMLVRIARAMEMKLQISLTKLT